MFQSRRAGTQGSARLKLISASETAPIAIVARSKLPSLLPSSSGDSDHLTLVVPPGPAAEQVLSSSSLQALVPKRTMLLPYDTDRNSGNSQPFLHQIYPSMPVRRTLLTEGFRLRASKVVFDSILFEARLEITISVNLDR